MATTAHRNVGSVLALLGAAVDFMTRRYPGIFRVRFRNRKGQNQWSRTYFIRYTFRGKTIREKTGSTSEEEAWKLRLKRLHEIGQGRLITGAGKVTTEHLEQLVQEDLTARGKKTADYLGKWFRPVHEHFGPQPMLDLKPRDLARYVTERAKKGAAPGTVSVELAWLARGYRLAVKSDMLPKCPEFPRIEVDNARRVFADWPVVERLLPHLPPHLRPVILTAHFSGWRKESILNRERALHLDLEGRWLYLERSANKSRAPVRIWLNDTLLEALRAQDEIAKRIELREARMVPWVFFYPHEGRNNVAGDRIVDFDHAWRDAVKAAGLEIRFHDLRRGAIRDLRAAGNSEHEIMSWLGLKTRAVFDRYDIIDEDRTREIGRKQQAHHAERQGKVSEFASKS